VNNAVRDDHVQRNATKPTIGRSAIAPQFIDLPVGWIVGSLRSSPGPAASPSA